MNTHDLHDKRLADAWATLQAHSDKGLPLDADPSRLAFADPEFLLRRETRGLRMQLELMKPDTQMREHGIENTVVVFGSARFRSQEESGALIAQAEAAGDALRRLLVETVEALKTRPRDAKFGRALELTYVRPAGSQELVAERLGLPFGTYRYQLATGIDRVAQTLWAQETA